MSTTISCIIAATAEHYSVGVQAILAQNRTRKLVEPRHMAMFLARSLTNKSYPEIGRVFARDHSTVIHAVKRMERLTEANPKLGGRVVAVINAVRLRDEAAARAMEEVRS